MVRAVFTVSGLLSLKGLTGAGGDRIMRTRAQEKIPRSTGRRCKTGSLKSWNFGQRAKTGTGNCEAGGETRQGTRYGPGHWEDPGS